MYWFCKQCRRGCLCVVGMQCLQDSACEARNDCWSQHHCKCAVSVLTTGLVRLRDLVTTLFWKHLQIPAVYNPPDGASCAIGALQQQWPLHLQHCNGS